MCVRAHVWFSQSDMLLYNYFGELNVKKAYKFMIRIFCLLLFLHRGVSAAETVG